MSDLVNGKVKNPMIIEIKFHILLKTPDFTDQEHGFLTLSPDDQSDAFSVFKH